MSQYLPVSDFSWMSKEEINSLDIMSVTNDAQYGYVFEVHINYPESLHEKRITFISSKYMSS